MANVANVKSTPRPKDVADDVFSRLAAVRSTVECIAASIQDERGIAGSAAEALGGVCAELTRIYCDYAESTAA
jgi:hypothetical protein